jgi:prophage antirepressor-like protein
MKEAGGFQDWVFEEVLPAIRKHGGYISPDATKEQLTNIQSDITSRLSAFESAYNLCKDQHDERGMLFIKDQVQT